MNPFLAEDDVGDDWLDDDLISKNPKRRKTTNYSTANYSHSVDTRNISLRLRHEHRELKPFETNHETSIADIASDTEELNISSTSLSRKLSSSSVKRKSQTTLKDAGFTRRKSNDSVKSIASNWSSDIPDETTPKKYEQDSMSFSTQPKYAGSTIMAINIHINNKIWRIPIQLRLLPNLTISSLAEEAAQRYYG